MSERTGIAGIGSFIMDHIRLINKWPDEQTLVDILGEEFSGGGLAHNLVCDIAQFDLGIPIEAIGLLGNDDDGARILNLCKEFGVDTTSLFTTDEAPTSYTEVMTVQSSGRRTFFHSQGANALINYEMIPFDTIKAKIAALGYLLLLDGVDAADEEFGTVAGKILHSLQARGIKTCIDTISENSERQANLAPYALKYCDYVIINELEAGLITGHEILDGETLDAQALRDSAKQLQAYGDAELVVIHMHIGAYALTREGEELFQPSLQLPEGYIKGGAGAGDAFFNGTLVGLHEDWSLSDTLKFATSAAAACLSHPTCTEGLRPHAECLKLLDEFPFRDSAL